VRRDFNVLEQPGLFRCASISSAYVGPIYQSDSISSSRFHFHFHFHASLESQNSIPICITVLASPIVIECLHYTRLLFPPPAPVPGSRPAPSRILLLSSASRTASWSFSWIHAHSSRNSQTRHFQASRTSTPFGSRSPRQNARASYRYDLRKDGLKMMDLLPRSLETCAGVL